MSCSSPCVLGLWWLCEIRMPGIDSRRIGRPIEVGGHDQPRPALEDEVLDPVAVAFQRPRDEHPRGPGVGGGQPERLPQGTQAGLAEPLPVVAGLHPVPLPVLPAGWPPAPATGRPARASRPAPPLAPRLAARPGHRGGGATTLGPLGSVPFLVRPPRPPDRGPPGGTPRPFARALPRRRPGRSAGGGCGRPPPGDVPGPRPAG